MCGIAGLVTNNAISPDAEAVQRMASELRHRGPDSLNIKCFPGVALAHTRLSIIDLKTGNQPIANEDKSIWVILNGEIYNYIELRKDLVAKGHIFSTKSDTEVIVHLYEEYGDDFVNQLNGQFAIALCDRRNKRVLLIRDRVGIAPLFYTQNESGLIFASEVKSLLTTFKSSPKMNINALDQIFTFWSPVSPNTIFKDIYEVSPGEMLVINYHEEGIEVQKSIYWDWNFPVNSDFCSLDDSSSATKLKELLIDAVNIRLRSDVPVGAYLSGGLDSSAIAALINNYTDNKLRTFSIEFEEKDFDESNYQNLFRENLSTEHSSISCANEDISTNFLNTIWHTESPILRTSPVPMQLLSGLVHKQNYRVVFTGEGADEVLGGYDIFKEAKIRKFWSRFPDSKVRPLLLRKLYPYLNMAQGDAYLKLFFGQGLDTPERFSFSHLTRWSSTSQCKEFFSDDVKSSINQNALDTYQATLPKEFEHWNYFNKAQYIEAKTLMGGYLLCSQGDRMLMSNSVEGRFPFLDHNVIEFANTLHPKLKMKGLNEKYLLKQAMSNELNKNIIGRYKQPYRAPNIQAFFGSDRKDYVHELLSESSIDKAGYFHSGKVNRLLKKIDKGRAIGNKDNMALVGILSTQAWHRHFIDNFQTNFKGTRRQDVCL